jgi:citronellol/citronellal dehydrogenase
MSSESLASSSLRPDATAGRVALVTGGGTGIGRATALELAATGSRVIVCGRRPEPLRETAERIEAAGGECLAISADIRHPEQVERVVDSALERFGAIDVLVNNAGGQFTAPAEKISDNGWRAVHRLAVDATWCVTRTVATRSMIPRGAGLVVFIGFSPQRGNPGFAHACAARAAVANLASGLAIEWGRHGIRSVCLAVGTILTEGLEQYGEAEAERWRRAIPLGRLGSPAEVAGLIAFLASPAGAYITATTIAVDGGADAWGMGEPVPVSE